MISSYLEILLLSFYVSGTALVISSIIGVPFGAWIGFRRFRARKLVTALLYTGMGLPPVVVGLFVYLLLSRSSFLGQLNLAFVPQLFTPSAMIVAEVIIALPLVMGLTMSAVMDVPAGLHHQIRSLGATNAQTIRAVLWEARRGVILAIIAGFGSIISEVGAVMLVGGNVEGQTRVLTTAIVLETRKGNFSLALWLGITLLAIAFLINFTVILLQGKVAEE